MSGNLPYDMTHLVSKEVRYSHVLNMAGDAQSARRRDTVIPVQPKDPGSHGKINPSCFRDSLQSIVLP